MICCFRIKRVKRLRVFAVFALLLPRVFAYTTATIIDGAPSTCSGASQHKGREE